MLFAATAQAGSTQYQVGQLGDDYYLRLPDKVVMIHGDVAIPLLIQSKYHYKLTQNGEDWDLTQISKADYKTIQGSIQPASYNLHYGDFDGDGQKDILLQGQNTWQDSFVVTQTKGAGSLSVLNASNNNISGNSSLVQVRDINGDGKSDILFNGFAMSFNEQQQIANVSANVNSNLVGSLPGDFSVEQGRATYSIPLDLPPGVNGLKPDLALSYRGQMGSGILGAGWRLQGLSSISRCSVTLEQDGKKGGIKYDSNDRFCLDGKRLNAVSGNYGANNTEYRTEIDNFTKVVSYGTAGNAPQSFKAWTKGGHIIEFGKTGDSRIEGVGRSDVRTWVVNKISDRSGNAITFQYDENTTTGEYSLNNIAYANSRVELYYDTRPDTGISFLEGGVIQRTKRLSQMAVFTNNTKSRRYVLGYQQSGLTKASLLTSVQQCDGGSNCLPATQLGWSAPKTTLTNQHQQLTGSDSWKTGDFNADGIADLIMADANNDYYVALGNKTGFETSKRWKDHSGYLRDHEWKMGDFNGDGKTDLIVGNNSGDYYVSLSTGSGFTDNSRWVDHSENLSQSDWKLGDFNGDGKTDFILADSGNDYWVSLSTGSGFATSRWLDRNGSQRGNDWELGDMNGDGMTDVVVSNQNQEFYVSLSTGSAFNGYNNWLSFNPQQWCRTGRVRIRERVCEHSHRPGEGSDCYWDYVSRYQTSCSTKTDWKLSDFNGDGKTDVIIADVNNDYWVGISSGDRFTATEWLNLGGTLFEHIWQLGDLNGDNLPDLVVQNENNLYRSAFSTGTGFDNKGEWLNLNRSASGEQWQLTDLDNDGKSDLMVINSSNDYALYRTNEKASGFQHFQTINHGGYLRDHRWNMADTNGDGRSDLIVADKSGNYWTAKSDTTVVDRLITITDGLGLTTNLEYKPLTDSSVYTKGTGASWPIRDIQAPIYVVSKVTQDDGVGGTRDFSYLYGDARSSLRGRGFQGFGWIESKDHLTNITTRREYEQSFPLTGRVKRTVSKLGNAQLAETTTDWVNRVLFGQNNTYNKTYFVYQNRSVAKEWDITGQTLVKTTTSENKAWDHNNGYSNLKQQKVTTQQPGAAAFTQTTDYAYSQENTDQWLIGRPTQVTVSNTAPDTPNQSRTTQFTYDANTGLVTNQVTDPGDALALTTATQYDSRGNPTTVTATGAGGEYNTNGNLANQNSISRNSTTAWDSQGLYPTRVTNALNQATAVQYNQQCGVVSQSTDSNGLTTHWEYDALCRLSEERRADGSRTQYSYAWASGDEHAPLSAKYKVTEQVDGQGPVTTYFDRKHRPVRTKHLGFDGTPVYTDTRYNARGLEQATSRPYFVGDRHYWTERKYDQLGRQTRVIRPATHGLGESVTQFGYSGLTTTKTDPLGRITTTRRDALERVIQVQQPLSAFVNHKYDALGNLVETNASGVITTIGYNKQGMRTALNDPSKGTWQYRYNAFGEQRWQKDAKGQIITEQYDSLGRLASRKEKEGNSTWNWDSAANGIGQLASVSGPDGYSRNYQYDNLSRLVNTTQTVDNLALSLGVEYDQYSRPAVEIRPGNFRVQNIYNQYGYLKAVRSPGNQVSDYDRSHLNGLIEQSKTAAQQALTKATELVTKANQYQTALARYQANSNSNDPQLQQILSDLDSVVQQINLQLEQALDIADKLLLVSETLYRQAQLTEAWGSDANATALQIADNDSTVTWWEAKYRDAEGRLSASLIGNGLTNIRNYDPASGQLLSIESGLFYGDRIRQLEYQYDKMNNITHRYDRKQGLTESFSFDSLDRLTSATVSGQFGDQPYSSTTGYSYDAKGNLLNRSDKGDYRYGNVGRSENNAGPYAVLSVGSEDDYTYDKNGNIVTGGGRVVEWASFDLPTRFEKNGKTVDFAYAPSRDRYRKITGSTTTWYLDKIFEQEQARENGKDIVRQKHFIYADGEIQAIQVKETQDGVAKADQTRYLHRDNLGSIDTITNAVGTVVERMSYGPFGSRRAGDWRSESVIGSPILPAFTNRGYTGHEMIDEVGLVHMNGRVYDQGIGRFLSADPVVQDIYDSQAFNRYAYVRNNPLRYTDPSGFAWYNDWEDFKETASNAWDGAKDFFRGSNVHLNNDDPEDVQKDRVRTALRNGHGIYDSTGRQLTPQDARIAVGIDGSGIDTVAANMRYLDKYSKKRSHSRPARRYVARSLNQMLNNGRFKTTYTSELKNSQNNALSMTGSQNESDISFVYGIRASYKSYINGVGLEIEVDLGSRKINYLSDTESVTQGGSFKLSTSTWSYSFGVAREREIDSFIVGEDSILNRISGAEWKFEDGYSEGAVTVSRDGQTKINYGVSVFVGSEVNLDFSDE
ncbi:FG-GAP-like repeat-containing protein [Sansalvadorimonas sp. 2012CJ34-2]|uniref:FG-GAP-like repeat-containing protein n=1 Tax=Parendozoicomonas callyspongiae TaxID=2942213 RepID=A0ABT0PH79_9GAMM|nr:FG-GAP-like repeat-containing protein [Sansalvadorimonas sp. 2012CJ34-2]MCL6270738.1 FG-GAP-like repeat-containing protein [Sansalvadorimonas sp. 2012CJ34-2]